MLASNSQQASAETGLTKMPKRSLAKSALPAFVIVFSSGVPGAMKLGTGKQW
jgi:hypothetical protein